MTTTIQHQTNQETRKEQAMTTAVQSRTNASSVLAALRARVTGEVITESSEQYDEARQTQNLTVDARPAALVRVANVTDVAEVVLFARENGYELAVRSGGHSIGKHSMIEGAIVVDFSAMKNITIDPQARTARIQAGATSGDLAGPAHAYGLALSTGDTASVGFGGLATGGGLGFMARKYGLAIDNLLSAQVVTADGRIVNASEDEHADLFWAIRGGGGNFGIITEFHVRLAPVGQVVGGNLILPATREAVRGFLDYIDGAPDELTVLADIIKAPPAPFVPEERVGETVLWLLICWSGDVEAGERAIAPLRALGEPIADVVEPMPYPVMYEFTAHLTERHGVAMRSMFADDLSDETIDASIAAVTESPSPFSLVHLRGMGGAISNVSVDATAFAHRSQRYWFSAIGVWLDPAEDPAPHNAWAEALWQQVRHERNGVYVNFLGREGDERIHEAYPGGTFDRLREIKRRYDPENVFKFNQNISP
jgi:FAD/FMN-containing dehydrogenase